MEQFLGMLWNSFWECYGTSLAYGIMCTANIRHNVPDPDYYNYLEHAVIVQKTYYLWLGSYIIVYNTFI